jgi:hypothetical protein
MQKKATENLPVIILILCRLSSAGENRQANALQDIHGLAH